MKRRVFIAIPLSETVSYSLDAAVAELEGRFPRGARIVPCENRHITVLFIGEVDETLMPKIEHAISAVSGSGTGGIQIDFDRIVYGPPGRTPRMVWLTTKPETSAALGVLQERLMRDLENAGVHWGHGNFMNYSGHITLARFEDAASGKPLNEPFENGFAATNLLLMESHLTPEGPAYRELSRAALLDA